MTRGRALADFPAGEHADAHSPLPFGIGIPYELLDCAGLTVFFLRHRGIHVRDPQQHPEDWVGCEERDAVAVTYRRRTHIAPLYGDGYVLETKRGGRSRLVRLSLLRSRELEFWRPAK